jgi:LuxR family quorum sensing-dependent transcriptional regulator
MGATTELFADSAAGVRNQTLRRALTLIDDLNRADSVDSGIAALENTLAAFGLEYFTLQDFPNPKKYEDFVFCHNVPSEWMKLYVSEKYNLIDPAFRACRHATEPFVWGDARYDPEQEPLTAKFVDRVADFGLATGLMIPVPHITARPGVVWFGGSHPELNRHTIPRLHLIALYTFERLRKFRAPHCERRPVLSAREREVLVWAAAGKSAWEIGEQLAIAKRTVDAHIEAAMKKLGAANRTHAVAIAVGDKLIDI